MRRLPHSNNFPSPANADPPPFIFHSDRRNLVFVFAIFPNNKNLGAIARRSLDQLPLAHEGILPERTAIKVPGYPPAWAVIFVLRSVPERHELARKAP
jgi:hypothetical protein